MYNHPMQNPTKKLPPHAGIHLITNRPEHQPSEVLPDINSNEYDNVEQKRAEHPSDYHPQLEDITELETDKENWDDSQFDDAELLYNHNSTKESDRIHHEYSAYFEKVKDHKYSPTIWHKESNTTSLNLIIIMPIHKQNSTRDSKTKTYTYRHPLYQRLTYMVW